MKKKTDVQFPDQEERPIYPNCVIFLLIEDLPMSDRSLHTLRAIHNYDLTISPDDKKKKKL